MMSILRQPSAVIASILLLILGSFHQNLRAEKPLQIKHADPAGETVEKYLLHIIKKDWKAAVQHILPAYLKKEHRAYFNLVHKAPNIDQELRFLGRIKAAHKLELESMSPQEFWQRDQEAAERQLAMPEKIQKQISDSFQVKIISVSLEADKNLKHVIARSSHQSDEAQVSELILMSLEKHSDGSWKISPGHSKPQVTNKQPK